MRTTKNKLSRAKDRLQRLENRAGRRRGVMLHNSKHDYLRQTKTDSIYNEITNVQVLIVKLEKALKKEEADRIFHEKVKGLGEWLTI